MTTQNWPDPKRPGVPLFPERDGIHLINMGALIGMYWSSARKHYSRVKDWKRGMSPADVADFEYCGPVLTPAQIAEMLAAERDRCAKVCEDQKPSEDNACTSSYLNSRWHTASRCAANIRNLGDAP